MKFVIDKSKSASQPYYWKIVSGNGQTLATSETYVAKESCKSAIASVQADAAGATIEDNT